MTFFFPVEPLCVLPFTQWFSCTVCERVFSLRCARLQSDHPNLSSSLTNFHTLGKTIPWLTRSKHYSQHAAILPSLSIILHLFLSFSLASFVQEISVEEVREDIGRHKVHIQTCNLVLTLTPCW